MTVLVLGAHGWLGSHYVRYFTSRMSTYGYGRQECDVTDLEQVCDALREIQPDVVINCAGITHSATIPNIDGCVESPEMQHLTIMVNAVGAANVAWACTLRGVKLVHIGSGCVFNGYNQIFTEDSEPNPPSYYATTKLQGDRAVLMRNPDALVLRIRMPISRELHPRNLITKLSRATQVIDVQNTVTVIEELLPLTERCLSERGIIHAVHPQPLHFRELMRWYRDCVDVLWDGEFIPKEQYKTQDGRSNAVVLSKRMQMTPTEAAVKAALHGYCQK